MHLKLAGVSAIIGVDIRVDAGPNVSCTLNPKP